jgi:hypothetical protein
MKQFLLPLLFSILLFLPLAAAEKGVGIMWMTQSEVVKESQINCINYSVYNPFSEDTNIYLTASGALQPFVIDSQSVLVLANTTHDKAIPISLCFNVPKVYKEDCMMGIACQRSCSEPEVTYVGEVIAAMAKTENAMTGGAGSATQAAASAPLTLNVSCEPIARSWTPIVAIIIVIAILLGLIVARRKKGIASA